MKKLIHKYYMDNNFYYQTNLELCVNTNLVLDETDVYAVLSTEKYNHNTLLTENSIKLLNNLGFEILCARVFACPPKTEGQFHIDGDYRTSKNKGSINFIINNDYTEWEMQWFSYPETAPVYLQTSKWSSQTTNATFITRTDLDIDYSKKLISCSFTKACVVRIDIPHRVVNYGNKTRYCVSVRVTDDNYSSILKKLNKNY